MNVCCAILCYSVFIVASVALLFLLHYHGDIDWNHCGGTCVLLRVVAFVPSFDRSGCFCCIMVAACGCWLVRYVRSDINRRKIEEDKEDQIKYSTTVLTASICLYLFLSVSGCLCLSLLVSVCFCLHLSVFVCRCLSLSVSVCFCLYVKLYKRLL